MKITRCSGVEVHFFDGDKYQVCPVCGKPAIDNASVTPVATPANQQSSNDKVEEPVKHRGLFGFGKKKENVADANNAPMPVNEEYDECGTIAMTEVIANQTVQGDTEAADFMDDAVVMPTEAMPEEVKVSTISQMIPPVPPMPEAPIQPSEVGIDNNVAINRAEYDSAKTVGVYADANTEPVVGWLICVKGESFGESFNLKAGKNSIGRGAGMDVMLAQERSVSRDKHAVITYEPKKKIFLIQPGDSSGLVYLNDDLLMTFAQLSSYDTIQLGEAVFKFVPFCGENFIWEDYLEK